jgi:hypothetical protein
VKALTSSSLSAFRDCPRKYYLMYVLRRVKVAEVAAMKFGTMMHEALAVYWLSGKEAMVSYLKTLAEDMTEQDAAKLAAMLTHYKPPFDKYEVEAVEQTFETRIINPETGRPMVDYVLQGKLDVLIIDKATRERWVLEHKSTSDEIEGFDIYWQRLAIDHQISFYILAKQAVGCLYDVLRKPTIKLCGKDETAAAALGISASDAYMRRCVEAIVESPAKYYQFREVIKTADDMEEAKADLWQQAHMLADCERQQRFPRNSGACRSFFGVCQYLGVCTGCSRIDGDDFRDKEAVNEELAK